MSYKCICDKEFNSSNELGKHKKKFFEIKKAIENAPLCDCGDKLGFVTHNGVLKYRTNCGKTECRSNKAKKFFTGRTHSDEHRVNLNKTKMRNNIRIKGEFRCEKCNKVFTSNTSLRAHKASCCKYEGKQFVCEVCGKNFKKNSGLATHKLSQHNNNPIYKAKMKKNAYNMLEKRKANKGTSNLEKIFEKQFLSGIKFSRQFRLNTGDDLYIYDFYIKKSNLIIEVDGDYWHINPKRFNFNEMPTYLQEYKQREHDKQSYAKQHSYNIVRFWEYDIHNNPDNIKEELDKWLKH